MDFAGAYIQENDLLSELLGDEDPKDIYKKSYYGEDSYDNDRIKNLYNDNEEDTAYTAGGDAYGTGYSSDELVDLANFHTSGYTDNFTEEEDENKEEEKKFIDPDDAEELPVSAKSTLNFGNAGMLKRGLSKMVSAPVVNLKNEKQEYQKKDWNKNFQSILDEEESESKYQRLSQIAHEFIFVAETYGKVIISEINVPFDQKTIKPISIGGQAGGEKYIAAGILFKFALDVGNLYGGNDEYAQKAAGHDLKGLIHYSLANIPGLHFPLMSLIHYMGYCLIAMSLLPIGKDSLKYGSSDAGKTMHFDVPAINEKMKAAGEALNLKGHIAGLSKYQSNLCYGPGDIECHLGKDGRFYVLDFARTFPPEAVLQDSLAEKGQILFKLLRPELVQSNTVPLSSDAFTGFGMSDPLHKTHNREVQEATERLFTSVIPDFITRSKQSSLNLSALDGNLVKEIHKEGINVRNLGLVRRLYTEDEATQIQILVEMIARVIKNKLKRQWRAITKVNQYITEEQCKQVSVVVLNKLYSDSEDSTKFWTQKMPKYLQKKFRYALFASEKDIDLRNSIDLVGSAPRNLLARIQQVTGILLSSTAWKDFDGFKSMTFVHSDIERIQPVIKNMHIIDVADTQLLLWNGIKSEGRESERIFSLALQKIEQNSFLVTLQITKMLKIVYQLYQKAKKDIRSISMNLASKLLDSIIRLQPKTETAYILYAKLRYLEEKLEAGLEKLQEGLTVLPNSPLLHCEYLKKSVHGLYKLPNPAVEENTLEAHKGHFEIAAQEGFLKGVANAYYAALLLLVGNETQQTEAVELLGVAQTLMPQKLISVLKLITSRFHKDVRAFPVLMPIKSLISPQYYSEFDTITEFAMSGDVNDAVVCLAATIFLKLSKVRLNKTETLSSNPLVELVEKRVDSLQLLQLSGFDDLSPAFTAALQLCKALTSLYLSESNITLPEILAILEHLQLRVLHIPAIKELTPSSLLSVLSFSSIKDLNISDAQLTKEDLIALLDNADVSRLFLDGIETLDLDMVQNYLARNNEIACLSTTRCRLPELEMMRSIYLGRHESLQVLILPSSRRLLFSGASSWVAHIIPHKLHNGSRIEIKLASDDGHDPAFQTLLILNVGSLAASVGGTVRQREDEVMMTFQETQMTRSITFQAIAYQSTDKFIVGTIVANQQQQVSYGGKNEFFSQNTSSYTCFGLQVLPNFTNSGMIRIPPRSDISFLLPLVAAFMLKRKATL